MRDAALYLVIADKNGLLSGLLFHLGLGIFYFLENENPFWSLGIWSPTAAAIGRLILTYS